MGEPRQRPDGTTVGRVFYPGCVEDVFVDTGIRSATATEGALTLPSLDLAPSVRSQRLQGRCDCSTQSECNGEDPRRMSCPYPTAAEAARHLRCGFDSATCAGPLDMLHVVALSTPEAAHSELDRLAAQGGSTSAKFVETQAQLRDALRAVFDAALADR